jgi:TonB family protein
MRTGSNQKVLGCYRTHLRPDFALEAADRSLFQRIFPKEARLLLEVKPARGDVSSAIFFLSENGQLTIDRATVEFPFNLRELGAEESPAGDPIPLPVPAPAAAKPAPQEEPKPAPSAPAGKPSRVSLVWKAAVAGVVVIATVVGLTVVRDGQSGHPQAAPILPQPVPIEKPAREQAAVPAANPAKQLERPRPVAPEPMKTSKPAPAVQAVAQNKTESHSPAAPFRQPQTVVAENRTSAGAPAAPPASQMPLVPPPAAAEPQRTAISAAAPPPAAAQAPLPNFRSATIAPPKPSPSVAPVQNALPLTPPRALRQVAPVVQDAVRRTMNRDVVVQIRATVDENGNVLNAASLNQGNPIADSLAGAAITAVKRWQFEPARRGEERVPGDIVLSFTFRK